MCGRNWPTDTGTGYVTVDCHASILVGRRLADYRIADLREATVSREFYPCQHHASFAGLVRVSF